MLTSKERLLNAIEREPVDRPPCICPGGMMNMVVSDIMDLASVHMPEAHLDARKMADLAQAVYDQKCFENYGVPFCMTVEAEDLGARVDMGSTVYEPHVVDYPIESVSEYHKLTEPDFDQSRSKIVLDAIKILKNETSGVPIIGNLTGPISLASSLIEPTVFYKELRKKNELAHEYMDFITRELIKFGQAQIEAGADIIAISDPSGTGEILGPKLFKEFVVKYMNQLIDGLKESNGKVIVHICGQMKSVYEEVDMIHCDVLSFDAFVSMREAKKRLSDRILMGNVSTYALEFGEPQKIKALTANCIRSGADIISPACGLGMKSPLENVQAILDYVVREEL